MYSESHRPMLLDEVFGHVEVKEKLKTYLTSDFSKSILLTGSPGIGKTTLALCAARTYGFEPLEINASKSIRSFDDVEKIKDSCRSVVSIHSMIRGEPNKKTCVILDEIDGSDPHAQAKIVAWMKDPLRKVPILCTGNEIPTIFKRNIETIEIIRCFPPKPSDVESLFPNSDVSLILKECQHDIRRVFHRMQYGVSDKIPKFMVPPTGLSVEKTFLLRQAMFQLPDPLREYHGDIQGIEHSEKTNSEDKTRGKDGRSVKS